MGAIAEQSTFRSSDGQSGIHYEIWYPEEGVPRAVVQMTHGMCDYIGRYRPFAEYLVAHGFAAAGHDHLGHGLSAAPENYGFFGEELGDQFLCEDVRLMNARIREKYPTLPIVLLGHSMGSFITRDYIARYGDTVCGYICMGTVGQNPMLGTALSMAKRQIREKGPRSPGDKLTRFALGGSNAKVPERRNPYDWLTRDTEATDAVADDPLCGFTLTASAYRDLFTILRRVSTRRWAEQIPKELPILLVSGDADPVGGYGKGVQKVQKLLRDAGSQDVTVKLYPEARHELLCEINRTEVFGDLLAFIERCVSQAGGDVEASQS